MIAIYQVSASNVKDSANVTDIDSVRFALDMNAPMIRAIHPFVCQQASPICMNQLQINRNLYFHYVLRKCSNNDKYSSLFLRSILCEILNEFSLALTVNSVELDMYRPNKHSWNDAIKFWEALYNNHQLNPPDPKHRPGLTNLNSNPNYDSDRDLHPQDHIHGNQENAPKQGAKEYINAQVGTFDDIVESSRQMFKDNPQALDIKV